MNKDIKLIRKFFSVNYSPLTCNVFYIDGWDTFYIFINESHYTVYDPSNFESYNKFELKDGSFYIEKADNMYTYFDNFLPHINIFIVMNDIQKANIYGQLLNEHTRLHNQINEIKGQNNDLSKGQ